MENALLFTGLLLGAALAGGYFGSCCAKGRQFDDVSQRVQALQDRLEFLETKSQNHEERLCLCERTEAENIHRVYDCEQRLAECELLIGETPNDGLLGRVGELEEARGKEDLLGRVKMLEDGLDTLQGRFDVFEGGMTLEMTTLREELEMRHGG